MRREAHTDNPTRIISKSIPITFRVHTILTTSVSLLTIETRSLYSVSEGRSDVLVSPTGHRIFGPELRFGRTP